MKVYFAWLPETLLFYRVRTQLLITMAATRKNKTIFKTFSCYFLFDPFLYLSLRSEELKSNFIKLLLHLDVFILIWNIQTWSCWLGIIDTKFGYGASDFPCRYLSPHTLQPHIRELHVFRRRRWIMLTFKPLLFILEYIKPYVIKRFFFIVVFMTLFNLAFFVSLNYFKYY